MTKYRKSVRYFGYLAPCPRCPHGFYAHKIHGIQLRTIQAATKASSLLNRQLNVVSVIICNALNSQTTA